MTHRGLQGGLKVSIAQRTDGDQEPGGCTQVRKEVSQEEALTRAGPAAPREVILHLASG